jgi:hypothetical protein
VAPGTPTVSSIVEDTAGGINAAEATDGTPVVVNLSGTGALAGDTVTVAWAPRPLPTRCSPPTFWPAAPV